MTDRMHMPHLKDFLLSDRITFDHVKPDTHEQCTAKETLGGLYNGWLYPHEIEEARAIAADPNATEEQAEAERQKLEVEASSRLAFWRNCQ
jgi:hypothetical protein